MLGELTNIPTDTLIDMLYLIRASSAGLLILYPLR